MVHHFGYKHGITSGQWIDRTSDFGRAFIIYDFLNDSIIKNETLQSDEEQLEFLINWYTIWTDAKLIADELSISWLLSKN